jgi:CubicO group peptidase (beta-lactamase class C family)
VKSPCTILTSPLFAAAFSFFLKHALIVTNSLSFDPQCVAENVKRAFSENFEQGLEVGAAVAVWHDGREIVHCAAGWADSKHTTPWTSETLVLVWSATKGLASACALHAIDSAGLAPNVRIAHFWPGFAKNGKADITVADVLSHQAGLAALEKQNLSIFDHDAVVQAIEEQRPLWQPRTRHAYSPRTFGFLADEIVRRLSGMTLGEYWREMFAVPMHLDFWIGLPEELIPRVAQMLPPRLKPTDKFDPFLQAMSDPKSLTHAAFSSIRGLHSVSAMNTDQARIASIPSLGGIGNATSLAKFYAMLASECEWEGVTYFSNPVQEWMQTRLVNGKDHTLLVETSFSAGFMMDPIDRHGKKTRCLFGPTLSAFGHPGAGGSMAFADPTNRVGFAYVMNQMEIGVLPNRRAMNLVNAVYACGLADI